LTLTQQQQLFMNSSETQANKIAGQLLLIFAVGPGKASISSRDFLSPVTQDFIDAVLNAQSPCLIPSSFISWASKHRTVELMSKMRGEFPLQPNNHNPAWFSSRKRKALVITMSDYPKPLNGIPSCKNDGKAIQDLLVKYDFNVNWLHNETSEKVEEVLYNMRGLGKSARDDGPVTAVFVYYSGLGEVDRAGFQLGISVNGKSFALESSIRNLSTFPNILMIGVFECCRMQGRDCDE